MDLEANRREQIETVNEIIQLWDSHDDDGHQTEELADLGYRLAELVLAAKEFEDKKKYSYEYEGPSIIDLCDETFPSEDDLS